MKLIKKVVCIFPLSALINQSFTIMSSNNKEISLNRFKIVGKKLISWIEFIVNMNKEFSKSFLLKLGLFFRTIQGRQNPRKGFQKNNVKKLAISIIVLASHVPKAFNNRNKTLINNWSRFRVHNFRMQRSIPTTYLLFLNKIT